MHIDASQRYTALSAKVWQSIAGGRLPAMLCDEIAVGYGSGRPCAACNEPIPDGSAEYEVKGCHGQRLPFHLNCYLVWQLECADSSRLHDPGLEQTVPAQPDFSD